MTENLDEKMEIAKNILGILDEEGEMRWTPLTKAVVHLSPSPYKSQVMISWLLRGGYVERRVRGRYNITEKGRGLLRVL